MPSPISTRVIAPKYPMFFTPKKKGDFVELPEDVEFNCDINAGKEEIVETQNPDTPVTVDDTKPYAEVDITSAGVPVIEAPVSEPGTINPVESTIAEDREAAELTASEGLPDTQENVASVVEETVGVGPEVVEEVKPTKSNKKGKKK